MDIDYLYELVRDARGEGERTNCDGPAYSTLVAYLNEVSYVNKRDSQTLGAVIEADLAAGERYFADHGTVHDRATGKHVFADESARLMNAALAECERMRAVFEAAVKWRATSPGPPANPNSISGRLETAIDTATRAGAQ